MAKPSWTAKGHGGSMGQPRYVVEPNRIFHGRKNDHHGGPTTAAAAATAVAKP